LAERLISACWFALKLVAITIGVRLSAARFKNRKRGFGRRKIHNDAISLRRGWQVARDRNPCQPLRQRVYDSATTKKLKLDDPTKLLVAPI
jgi:hypothetical protein